MTETAATGSTQSLWRDGDFLRYWGSRAVTMVGSSVTAVALPVLIYELTGSPALTSGLMATSTMSMAFFGLIGGVLGDRFDRRRIMVTADLVSALAIASIVVAHLASVLTVVHVYAAAFASASAAVLFDGSSAGALPSLVGRSRLPDANARIWGTQSVLDVAMPAAAGLALAIWSPATLLVVDVLSFLGSMLLVRAIRGAMSGVREVRGRATVRDLWGDLVEGLTWLRRHPTLWPLAMVSVFGAGSAAALLGLIVPWADRVLGVGTSGWRFGLLFGSWAAGAFFASFVMPRLSRRFGAIRMAQVLFPMMTVLLAVLSRLDRYGPALAVYLAYSFLHVLVISATVTYRMQIVPDRLLSRVSTASRTISWGGGATIGVLVSGQVASRWGVPAALLVVAVANGCAALLAWVPALRHAAPTARYAESA
ncbi:putative MFS family arabinose efflux permease [Knoellia remsis]|uniref:Putative MFS family arabinose efflux permease n=1 Tax=Knoellia remsis TaxID=407159 RepID=A0A2T0UZN4_9MICO|nr:MFS transporter [Knoellia remsis]PRY63364.1 putative MFS family arabinose efflux permease [Knoellia remsis]